MEENKEVGAWSDSRWVGNTYSPGGNGIILPGQYIVDKSGNKVAPIEYGGGFHGSFFNKKKQSRRKR